jgi:hypothetical protein
LFDRQMSKWISNKNRLKKNDPSVITNKTLATQESE